MTAESNCPISEQSMESIAKHAANACRERTKKLDRLADMILNEKLKHYVDESKRYGFCKDRTHQRVGLVRMPAEFHKRCRECTKFIEGSRPEEGDGALQFAVHNYKQLLEESRSAEVFTPPITDKFASANRSELDGKDTTTTGDDILRKGANRMIHTVATATHNPLPLSRLCILRQPKRHRSMMRDPRKSRSVSPAGRRARFE